MAWDYNEQIGGTPLTNYADMVRFVGEPIGGVRGKTLDVAYKHGAYAAGRHWAKAQFVVLETLLRYTDSAGAITHTDGAAGHVYQNRSELARLMKQSANSIFTMTRVVPDYGTLRARFISLDEAAPIGGTDHLFRWPLWNLDGGWESNVLDINQNDTSLGASGTIVFTTGGNMETYPVFTIDCTADGANPSLTLAAGSLDALTLSASYVAADQIIIDVGERTVTLNGTREKTSLQINRGWWMELLANTTNLTINWASDSGTWDVNTAVRNKWR
jgi:hypothetical protein